MHKTCTSTNKLKENFYVTIIHYLKIFNNYYISKFQDIGVFSLNLHVFKFKYQHEMAYKITYLTNTIKYNLMPNFINDINL